MFVCTFLCVCYISNKEEAIPPFSEISSQKYFLRNIFLTHACWGLSMTMRSSLLQMFGHLCTVFQGLTLYLSKAQKVEQLADDALSAVSRARSVSQGWCLSAVPKPSASASTDCSH